VWREPGPCCQPHSPPAMLNVITRKTTPLRWPAARAPAEPPPMQESAAARAISVSRPRRTLGLSAQPALVAEQPAQLLCLLPVDDVDHGRCPALVVRQDLAARFMRLVAVAVGVVDRLTGHQLGSKGPAPAFGLIRVGSMITSWPASP